MQDKILTISLATDVNLEMIYIEGGEFLMGDDGGKYQVHEKPAHKVNVKPFYLGKYQVTQSEWQAVMKNNPSLRIGGGENQPVDSVSWDDVQNFIKKFTAETGKKIRLPTEAEWEFAARGGIHSQGYTYSGSDKLKQVGWHAGNSKGRSYEVGFLLANELGLYDMSGNVWEWCEDDWHFSYSGAPEDGSAWVEFRERWASRVVRGGYYLSSPKYCRSSSRYHFESGNRRDDVGFRLALSRY